MSTTEEVDGQDGTKVTTCPCERVEGGGWRVRGGGGDRRDQPGTRMPSAAQRELTRRAGRGEVKATSQ